MIPLSELAELAKTRYADAKALFQAGRFDGAVYLCGYAMELALKARICTTLNWISFPQSSREFEPFKSFKTHDLDVLLRLSGIESSIRTNFATEWSLTVQWNPELRYRATGTASQADAMNMLQAVQTLMSAI
jgi:hypothetical protein